MIGHDAIAVGSTRTSARNIQKVDVGIASPEENGDVETTLGKESSMARTCSASRRGFFNGRGTSVGGSGWQPRAVAASVPARLARRRLIAGPIPAVSFETGLYRFTH